MSNKFDPEKLRIKFIPPMNLFGPIEGRKYTLTHSDETGELFLTVGNGYDMQNVDHRLRDEVLAEWQTKDGEYHLIGNVYISDGEYDAKFSKIRYMIFKKELEVALTGIIYGDKNFFQHYPWLIDRPIIVHFHSVFPEYNQVHYYGTPRQYLVAANRKMSKTQA